MVKVGPQQVRGRWHGRECTVLDNRSRRSGNQRINLAKVLFIIVLTSIILSLNTIRRSLEIATRNDKSSDNSGYKNDKSASKVLQDVPAHTSSIHVEELKKKLEEQELESPFDTWLASTLPTIVNISNPLGSEIVELRHCSLHRINFTTFAYWAGEVLNEMKSKFEGLIRNKAKTHGTDTVDEEMTYQLWDTHIHKEFTLQLLEIFATHNHYCNFENYPLQIMPSTSLDAAATILKYIPSDPTFPRFAFVIVAFKDSLQLQRIIQALHMPHHAFIVHLDKQTSVEYQRQVVNIASKYHNVAVVKFSSVTYKTDSISLINLQIMNWLVHDVQLKYDYHFTMGGAVYPLWSSHQLAAYLKAQNGKRDVWLGELAHNGKILHGDDYLQWDYLQRKRLIYTSGMAKWQSRTKTILKKTDIFTPEVPDFIKTHMRKKTNSGNQAVFSFSFVKKLLSSAQAKQLFALAKYGCCCCLEERTWITAARILGFGEQAMKSASMFQLWGGMTKCQSSMNNAVLGVNNTLCYKNEDATPGSVRNETHNVSSPVYIWGDDLFNELKRAKARGFLFARKFKSEDASSMALLTLVNTELHSTNLH